MFKLLGIGLAVALWVLFTKAGGRGTRDAEDTCTCLSASERVESLLIAAGLALLAYLMHQVGGLRWESPLEQVVATAAGMALFSFAAAGIFGRLPDD